MHYFYRIMKRRTKILLGLLAVLVIIQFIRPAKNNGATNAGNGPLSETVTMTPEVSAILKTSCYDCHSNKTAYPWYAEVQPVGWWLQDHVNEGKEELNFDEFAAYSPRRQYRKLEEIGDQVKEGEMPLSSYTLIHGNAKLSAEQQQTLTDWVKMARGEMEAKFPADSLKMKKR